MRILRFTFALLAIYLIYINTNANAEEPTPSAITLGPMFEWNYLARDGNTHKDGVYLYMTFAGKLFISSASLGDTKDQISAIVNMKGGSNCSRENTKFGPTMTNITWAKLCAKVTVRGENLYDVAVTETSFINSSSVNNTVSHNIFIDRNIVFRLYFDHTSCRVTPLSAKIDIRSSEIPQQFEGPAIRFTMAECRCNMSLLSRYVDPTRFGTSCEGVDQN